MLALTLAQESSPNKKGAAEETKQAAEEAGNFEADADFGPLRREQGDGVTPRRRERDSSQPPPSRSPTLPPWPPSSTLPSRTSPWGWAT